MANFGPINQKMKSYLS